MPKFQLQISIKYPKILALQKSALNKASQPTTPIMLGFISRTSSQILFLSNANKKIKPKPKKNKYSGKKC